MPKLIVSIDGVVVKEVQITRDRSTIGRRPYNDVVIDNLAVSGEHAVIHLSAGHAMLEDLGSTNGTYINGKAIKKQALAHEDTVEVGKYKIKFLESDGSSSQMALATGAVGSPVAGAPLPSVLDGMTTEPAPVADVAGPRVRVLSGSAAGRELMLTKVVTTIGKPGQSIASIIRKQHGYDLSHVEGEPVATVNGVSVDAGPILLKNRDQIELGGIRLEFIER